MTMITSARILARALTRVHSMMIFESEFELVPTTNQKVLEGSH